MLVVAGLSLKNLHPRVWDATSPYFLPQLSAVMLSYADFKQMRVKRLAAQQNGLHKFLKCPKGTSIFLDNGAFYFAVNGGKPTSQEYRRFVRGAKPTWKPIRFDAIPAPQMKRDVQRKCYRDTMAMNLAYQHDGYVPVAHAGTFLANYLSDIAEHDKLSKKKYLALGGLVPNLLRTPKAAAYSTILDDLIEIRRKFPKKRIHVFGIGGTATLHLTALLGFDSIDSSGWRNRAARGMIQLPGSGERVVADNLGKWRGKGLSAAELRGLHSCGCPACKKWGVEGLKESGLEGFCKRATHNLWVLLDEARWVNERLQNGNYEQYYKQRLDNTIYLPLIEEVLRKLRENPMPAR